MRIRRTVFIYLMLIFFVTIVPILFFSYGIFHNGYRLANKHISETMYTRSYYYLKSFQDEIERVKQLQIECANDDDIYYYANAEQIMKKYDQVQALLEIQDKLITLRNSSEYIDDVILWLPENGNRISASEGVEKLDDEWKELTALRSESESGLIFCGDSMYFCTTYPLYSGLYNIDPTYILAIKFSKEKIVREMRTFNVYPGSGTMLAMNGNDFAFSAGKIPEDAGKTSDISLSLQSSLLGNAMIVKDKGGEEYLSVRVYSPYLNADLSTYTPTDTLFVDLENYRKWAAAFSLMAVAIIAVFIVLVNRFINEPIKRLISALNDAEKGDLNVHIDYRGNDDFRDLYHSFNHMIRSLKKMMELNAQQLMLTRDADYKQLQAQINPHFLYNSFFILYRMAKEEDYENITEFVTYLSDYYRYITRNEGLEDRLENEDSHARRYVQIQLVRFRKKITVDFGALPEEIKDLMAPRLIIQPLIENAFAHGLKDVAENGKIIIGYVIDKAGSQLVISVEDNGTGLTQEQYDALMKELNEPFSENTVQKQSAVVNIHHRIQIKYGDRYGIRAERLSQGVRFSIVIPIENVQG